MGAVSGATSDLLGSLSVPLVMVIMNEVTTNKDLCVFERVFWAKTFGLLNMDKIRKKQPHTHTHTHTRLNPVTLMDRLTGWFARFAIGSFVPWFFVYWNNR